MVTDSVYIATENIVWEALWNQARQLKKRQIEDLEKHFLGFTSDSSSGGAASQVDSHMLNILRENYQQPLNTHHGQSLVNKKWAELLYHTNRYMQRGSLMDNYAIRKLQEQIIGQVTNINSLHLIMKPKIWLMLQYRSLPRWCWTSRSSAWNMNWLQWMWRSIWRDPLEQS